MTYPDQRHHTVIYDRAHSAIAEADPSDFDFDKIMEGAQWFHWSGIKDMLDRNISFSLYMTHGGTTFGWWRNMGHHWKQKAFFRSVDA